MKNKTGTFYSWIIYDKRIAVKNCDKSFFEYNSSGIPTEVRWFFNVENLANGAKVEIKLTFNKVTYDAYIAKETDISGRTRIFWHSDLKDIFNKYDNKKRAEYPTLRFEKIKANNYTISFINENKTNEVNLSFENEIEVIDKKEGKKIARYVTLYERNKKNRQEAIKFHGTNCMACGFNFEEVYGEYAREFIEVHHIKPLFEMDEELIINPKTDLICICSNCHRVIHLKKNNVLSLYELKLILKKNTYK
ncbi:HNH endonuclease [Maribellus mangrovi]|uniref:HNH endonuclease n=1 Tax=Maribellus mangrovi TaxID=3133146 RepID=UPI0030EDB412